MVGVMSALKFSMAAALAATGWVGLSASARAQDDDNFSRDRNVSVRDRPKPEYDPIGIPLGGFRLYPELDLSAEYSDNVFGTQTNKQADTLYHVAGQLDLRSQWANHALDLAIASPSTFYSKNNAANFTDATAHAYGRLDVYRDFNVHGTADYGDLHEPIETDPSDFPLKKPIQYQFAHGNIGFLKAFNRVRVSGEVDYANYDYKDGRLFDNTPVFEQDRDHEDLMAGARVDYAMSPRTALFFSVAGNEHDYRLKPPASLVNRNSNGVVALTGVNFDITHAISGEVGVGYLKQSYDDPTVSDTSGLAVRANVKWFPDELITVSFGASREVDDAGAFGATSYIANNASFAIDYEWRRDTVFGLSANYSKDDYQGIDRTDDVWNASLRVDHLVNRGVALFAEAGHYEQTSSGVEAGRDYEINRALIGIRLRR
jgi:hypothetical protein